MEAIRAEVRDPGGTIHYKETTANYFAVVSYLLYMPPKTFLMTYSSFR